MKRMSRLEFLAVMLSLKTLIEESKIEKALELINRLVDEAEKSK